MPNSWASFFATSRLKSALPFRPQDNPSAHAAITFEQYLIARISSSEAQSGLPLVLCVMSHFNASKVIIVGGTCGPNSLEKSLFGNPQRLNRGSFTRKSVTGATSTNGESLTKAMFYANICASVFSENGGWGETKQSPPESIIHSLA